MVYTKEMVEGMKVKELLVAAKELNVVGRHDMKKDDLKTAIVEASELKQALAQVVHTDDDDNVVGDTFEEALKAEIADELSHWESQVWEPVLQTSPSRKSYVEHGPSDKSDYIDKAKEGHLVAFKASGGRMLSGKIKSIVFAPDGTVGKFIVETRNQHTYHVLRSSVVWVKTGLRWPRGIYLALQGVV